MHSLQHLRRCVHVHVARMAAVKIQRSSMLCLQHHANGVMTRRAHYYAPWEVATGSPWSSIDIEAQNCLFDCTNQTIDVIYNVCAFAVSTLRQPRFIWGLEAGFSDFRKLSPRCRAEILCRSNAKIKTVWPYSHTLKR